MFLYNENIIRQQTYVFLIFYEFFSITEEKILTIFWNKKRFITIVNCSMTFSYNLPNEMETFLKNYNLQKKKQSIPLLTNYFG